MHWVLVFERKTFSLEEKHLVLEEKHFQLHSEKRLSLNPFMEISCGAWLLLTLLLAAFRLGLTWPQWLIQNQWEKRLLLGSKERGKCFFLILNMREYKLELLQTSCHQAERANLRYWPKQKKCKWEVERKLESCLSSWPEASPMADSLITWINKSHFCLSQFKFGFQPHTVKRNTN